MSEITLFWELLNEFVNGVDLEMFTALLLFANLICNKPVDFKAGNFPAKAGAVNVCALCVIVIS
ncbi:hypothetical protein [Shewanella sp. Isolate8]|uniref:hypothetical protein n=1 Tax=Shewanella sp. Isolate8 TaxID=2908529 RepID=UPI001EFD4328|nr:hypothetical protein [Shewanella sp. Isolate8]MCG9747564.1 hypothetical protein [Shewanella sp. Isolate8]